jgi:hypothetical protein
MKKLSKERITEIVNNSENAMYALIDLYKEVMAPVKWEEVISIEPSKFHTNRTTSAWIIEELQRKTPENKEGIALLILNKGFSGGHDELKDWEVEVEKDAFEFTVK